MEEQRRSEGVSDPVEQVERALAAYMTVKDAPDWAERAYTHRLVGLVEEYLPAILARLRAAEAAVEKWRPVRDDEDRHTDFLMSHFISGEWCEPYMAQLWQISGSTASGVFRIMEPPAPPEAQP